MEQTYISKWVNSAGSTVEFQRWNFKRLNTVEKNIKKLYSTYSWMLKDIIKANGIRCNIYKTESNGTNEQLVQSINITDFTQA